MSEVFGENLALRCLYVLEGSILYCYCTDAFKGDQFSKGSFSSLFFYATRNSVTKFDFDTFKGFKSGPPSNKNRGFEDSLHLQKLNLCFDHNGNYYLIEIPTYKLMVHYLENPHN